VSSLVDPEEQALKADPRLGESITLFNQGEWYACHDGFEELWHGTNGPMRAVLQGILQIAVSQIHRERGNLRGATVLMGEGLGRLQRCDREALGLDLDSLRQAAAGHLHALQGGQSGDDAGLQPLKLLSQPDL